MIKILLKNPNKTFLKNFRQELSLSKDKWHKNWAKITLIQITVKRWWASSGTHSMGLRQAFPKAGILMTNTISCSQWLKVCFFPISRRKNYHHFVKSLITTLCHSKLYFCIRNFEMCLSENQIFDFLFYLRNRSALAVNC